MLERIHSYADVVAANLAARKAGFDNLSFDLIFGLPGQSLDYWQATLKLIVSLYPEHLSLYALTIEEGTLFGRWAERGMLPLPDPDLAAEMYEWASEFLVEKGFYQYEISNWAKIDDGRLTVDREKPSTVYRPPSFMCKHNLQYWRNLPYLGFGVGAHGYANGMRYSNLLGIQPYIERLSRAEDAEFPLSPTSISEEEISSFQAMQETMMLGLRLTQEGVSAQAFQTRFGRSMQDVFGAEIDELVALGLLEWVNKKTPEALKTSDILRLTPRARLLGNQVFRRFVGE